MSSPRGLPSKPSKGERRKQAGAYEGAVEAVIAVIAAIGLGYWADTHFDSSPVGLFAGVVIGFTAMVLRLVRLGRQFGVDESPNGQENGQDH